MPTSKKPTKKPKLAGKSVAKSAKAPAASQPLKKSAPMKALVKAKDAAKANGPMAKPAQKTVSITAKAAAPKLEASVPVSKPAAKAGPKFCRESACENEPSAGGDYCRAHYIRNWRKIKRKEVILKEKKLNQYIEELVAKYPEKYIETIKLDLTQDKEFSKVVHDLELNMGVEDDEGESETIDSLLDNIRKDIEVSGAAPPDDEDEIY